MSIHSSVMHQCVLRGLKFAESHRGAIVAVANAYSLEAPGCSSPESVDPQETHAHPHVAFITAHGCTKGKGGMGGDSLAVHDIVLVLFPAAYLWFAERALCFGARARVGAWVNDGVVDVFATGSARGGSLPLRMLCKARRLHTNLQRGRDGGLPGVIRAPAL